MALVRVRDWHLVQAVQQQESAASLDVALTRSPDRPGGGEDFTQVASAASRSPRCQVRPPRPQSMPAQKSRSGTKSGSRPRKVMGFGSANASGAGTG